MFLRVVLVMYTFDVKFIFQIIKYGALLLAFLYFLPVNVVLEEFVFEDCFDVWPVLGFLD